MTLRQMIGMAITNTCSTLSMFFGLLGDEDNLKSFIKEAKEYYFNEFEAVRTKAGAKEAEVQAALDLWKKKDAWMIQYQRRTWIIANFLRSATSNMFWIRRTSILASPKSGGAVAARIQWKPRFVPRLKVCLKSSVLLH
jgi:hypothetical protein